MDKGRPMGSLRAGGHMDANIRIPVIIIDDEALIRSLIIRSIDWKELGFSIVAEADNSDDALRLVQETNPQIALIDINIPYINGLQLAKIIRNSRPDMAIIILTGYEEFSYAQEAIHIGVTNYLLKPLNALELKQSLTSIHLRIMERERGDFVTNLSRQLDLGSDLKTKEEFMRILVMQSNEIPRETLQRGAELFNLDLNSTEVYFFQVFLFITKSMTNRMQVLSETWIEPLERVFPISLQWTFDYQGSPVLIAFWHESREGVCLSFGKQIAVSLRHQLTVDFSIPCSIGIGPLETDATLLTDSYHGALDALSERFYRQSDHIFEIRKEYSRQLSEELLSFFDPKGLIVLMRCGAESQLHDAIRNGIRIMQEEKIHRAQCNLLILRYIDTLEQFLHEQNLTFKEIFGDSFDSLSEFQSIESLPSLRAWLEWFTAQTFLTVVNTGKSRTHFIVLKAKQFIECHYRRHDLNLDLIAEHVTVSPNYLSGTFKKILGTSIVTFLTEFRMNKAKELMDMSPLLSISEIAEAVGYSDASYFSKVFTRQEGLTPSHYIKRKCGNS